MRILPVALVEDQALVEHGAVQADLIAVNADLAHAEIREHRVRDRFAAEQLHLEVVEVRGLRRPGAHVPFGDFAVRDVQRNVRAAVRNLCERAARRDALKARRREHVQVVVLRRFHRRLHAHGLFRHLRRELQRCDPAFRRVLEPHGFPDAGRLYVPAGEVFRDPALLAARLAATQAVRNVHRKPVFAGVDEVCDVERKARVAAAVLAGKPAVHKHARVPVAALKVQQHAAVVRLHRDRARIPDVVVRRFNADAAALRLVGERHLDRVLRRKAVLPAVLLAFCRVVEREVPRAVQVFPVCADHLRARIIRNIVFQCNSSLFLHSPLRVPSL